MEYQRYQEFMQQDLEKPEGVERGSILRFHGIDPDSNETTTSVFILPNIYLLLTLSICSRYFLLILQNKYIESYLQREAL